MVLGRGGRTNEDPHPRLVPVGQRPGTNEALAPIADPFVSTVQLEVTRTERGLSLVNVGKRSLCDAQGREHERLDSKSGDVVEIRGRLLLLVAERPRELAPARSLGKKLHGFGEADMDGLVGESPSAWQLRDAVAFVAARAAQHVLLLGESGTGKEIVANAIHRLSSKGGRRLVSRNAATLPAGLIDAELFGHVANYPNAGMPERPGLIAEADGSTLFLDEIGELGHDLSSKLLRVLDEKGEYQRLGDSRMRTSSFRLIGATNRPFASLKEDLAARFRLRILVPSLGERREDIPLLVRHLLRRAAAQDPAIGERFFEAREPRIAIDLMKALVLHRYRTHIRELDALLWSSLASSPKDVIELTPTVANAVSLPRAGEDDDDRGDSAPPPRVDARTLTAADVRAALERAGGSHDKAWRDLGLGSRHVLKRLKKKLGVE